MADKDTISVIQNAIDKKRNSSSNAINDARAEVFNNKVLGKYLTPENFDIVIGSPSRKLLSSKFGGGGGLEFWNASEAGLAGYSHPSFGKNISEIYDSHLLEDSNKLKGAVFRDALHILPGKDKYWNELRDSLIASTPIDFFEKWKESSGDKRPLDVFIRTTAADALVRGAFGEESEFGAAYRNEPTFTWNGKVYPSEPTIYSSKQRDILGKMYNYIMGSNTIDYSPSYNTAPKDNVRLQPLEQAAAFSKKF